MNVTVEQLRRLILNEVDSDSDGVPDSEELVAAWTFAPTAEEEAKKINAQTGIHLVTDPKHWAEYGIHTGEELARTLLASTYSDTYKSIHGIRPRWVRTSEMSVQEIQKLLSDLEREAEERSESEGWESDIEDEIRDAEHARMDAEDAAEDKRASEEARMKIPEEGEEFPAQQGMGRRSMWSGEKKFREGRISESLTGLDKQYYGRAVQDIVQTFRDNMLNLFDDMPAIFQGRSSGPEWEQQVKVASEEFQERLENSVVDITRKVEDLLHDGQFRLGDLSGEGSSLYEGNIRNGNKIRVTKLHLRRIIKEEIGSLLKEKKKKGGPLAKLAKDVEERGTEGSFSEWCGEAGVTQECIDRAVRQGGRRARQASLAVTFSKAKGGGPTLSYPKK